MQSLDDLRNIFNKKEVNEEIIEELASYGKNITHKLIECFETANISGKRGIIETLSLIGDPLSISFLKKVTDNQNENYLIKASAEGALDKLQKQEESVKRKIAKITKQVISNKKLNSIEVTNLVSDIAMLGSMGSSSSINQLFELSHSIPRVNEQVKVAKLHVQKGIEAIISEYKKKDSIYSKDALLEAIYCSYETKERKIVIPTIIEDLSSSEYVPLFNSLLRFCDKDFPKDVINNDIKERLFSILKGNYKANLKDYAAQALGNVLTRKDQKYVQRLESILKELNSKNKFLTLFDFNGNYLKETLENSLRKIKRN
ncbi:hypothetical protein B5V89_13395 [Heyndrickxia sporothermodurans]|uniref:hypothetical protein n=1 Tax=Heyndrickxia TaxID=2837504 RepID=UPI000D3624DA|nr:hypothetical protein [Heyndrickxia sporothermodurans]PTY77786.1 hypothetical protein B5V89_13395 [Heyndrickxia sporothermodurans]